jgi:hypothetical protein
MKRTILILALVFLPALVKAASVNYDALLVAIAETETGSDSSKIGKAGERGMYQITYGVWKQHAKISPFKKAHDPVVAKIVAERHLAWLEREIAKKDYEVTAERLALCWNAGLTRGLSGQPFASSLDYARRVNNRYVDLLTPKE